MSQECQQPQAHSARRGCEEKKSYPDRLCHADYTAHPYHCGCLKGDAEAQRRFDEHQHHAAVPPAGGSLKCWNCKADFTLSERANCDGCCWKCGNEIDLDDYVTRLQAENAALQQRLNVADQRVDDLESDIAKARESNGKLQSLARRTLWLAYVWNDHNFGPAHQEARTEAKKNGIESFEQANEFLESCLAHQSAPAAKGESDE
ncbi:hypothetical protein D3M70_00010 [Pseudomonas sp. LS-2]|nr:hypothetical protein D3M70_00010 [Pseudomonas sp. LS-2]